MVGALAVAWTVALLAALLWRDLDPNSARVPDDPTAVAVVTEVEDPAGIDAALPAAAVGDDDTATASADGEASGPPGVLLTGTEVSAGLEDALAGRTVHVIGDSLALSAADEIRAHLGAAVSIDAESGLGLYYAADRIENAAVGADIVVIELGTNDWNAPDAFIESVGRALDTLAGASCLVWVDTQPFAPGADELRTINAGILAAATARGHHVAGWSQLAGPDELHASDGYHLSAEGQQVFADLIVATIETACL